MRLDKAIFERGLAQSRSRAAQLIDNSSVTVNGNIISKASYDINENDVILVTDTIGYVGRGGMKLECAFKSFGISPKGLEALDIGASTGGFTQCLLRLGATSVIAVDVGHGQMHETLLNDERVRLLENFNAKNLTPEIIDGRKDIAVMDVSFISQTEIYSAMFSCLKDDGYAITLVKPQFEAGSKYLNKKGIIKNKKVYLDVFDKIQCSAHEYFYSVDKACASPILGGDGNIEFLVLLKKGVFDYDFTELYNSVK